LKRSQESSGGKSKEKTNFILVGRLRELNSQKKERKGLFEEERGLWDFPRGDSSDRASGFDVKEVCSKFVRSPQGLRKSMNSGQKSS